MLFNTIKMILAFAFDVNTPHLGIYPTEVLVNRTKVKVQRTSLVFHWLRLCTPNVGGPGLIPGQGTRSYMPQIKVRMPQLRPTTANK